MESTPKYELPIKTATKKAMLISSIMSGFWILVIIYTIIVVDLTDPTNIVPTFVLNVFFGLTVLIPLSIGILRKEVTLIFKIDEPNRSLIYESHWGNYHIFSKSYPFIEIKHFEVHNIWANPRSRVTQYQFLALCFQSRRPKYLTNYLDSENSTEFAQKLNKFLADNTQINIDSQALSTTPYTPKSQITQLIIFTIIMAIFCIISCYLIIYAIILVIEISSS